MPLIDLANHARGDAITAELRIIDADKDDATFALFSTKPLRAGEQVRDRAETSSHRAAFGEERHLIPAGAAATITWHRRQKKTLAPNPRPPPLRSRL